MTERAPRVIVLGGINGAGKTTAARSILAETLKVMTFVNADAIAQGLSGFDPETEAIAAGRIMLRRLDELAAQRADFAFETTLAARTYASWLRELRDSGYDVELLYFWLNSPDLAVGRVAQRVATGGHHIPEETIRRRYRRSLQNFVTLYRPVSSVWEVYDNSQSGGARLLASGAGESEATIVDAEGWQRFLEEARK